MKRLQYTVRNVTPEMDRGLRQTARKKRQSLNDTLLEALRASLGTLENHDLDFVAGTWVEDVATDKALKDQRKIDKNMQHGIPIYTFDAHFRKVESIDLLE